jgi:hypothetical protein
MGIFHNFSARRLRICSGILFANLTELWRVQPDPIGVPSEGRFFFIEAQLT